MAKKTLLEIVQDILNDLDSDEANSIDDTIESQQVAQIVRTCFEELTSNRNWPHLKKLIQMESSNSLSYPNYLVIPDSVKELVSLQYDCATIINPKIQYRTLTYKYPDEFLAIVNTRDSTLSTILTVTDYSGSKLLILNNKAPDFWTSFDDEHIVCDSYDSNLEATLQKAKTQCFAVCDPVWVHDNDAIPDLPSEAFSLLIEEAKSTAFIVLKQTANQKAEQKSARQNRWLARKAWKAKGGVRYDNYGRTGKK